LAGTTAISQTVSSPSATPTPPGSIALGVFITDNGNYINNDPALLDSYARLVGHTPAVVNIGSDWVHHARFDPAVMDSIWSRGVMPMWTWMPGDYNMGPSQPAYSLVNIVAGRYDAYIRQFAADAKNWGRPFFLRFAHEMNGNWYPWGTAPGNVSKNSHAQYIAAWRHVHDIFARVGATNVRWVWCTNVEQPNTGPVMADYPGDRYVDWLALDGYNWGGTPGHAWQTLAQVFGPSYSEVTHLSDKPVMIGETASAEEGGSKAAWITQGFLSTIPQQLPRVRVVLWFDAKVEHDWRVNSSSASLAAFRQVAAAPIYHGTLR
jgi:hypothetical protein